MDRARPMAKMGRPIKAPGERPTRDRILEVAIGLFAENGYDGTSVRQIAGALGLTESAIYRHFPNKEAILETILAFVDTQVTSPLAFETDESACEDGSIFRLLLEGLAEAFASNPLLIDISRILYTEASHNALTRRFLKEAYEEKADELTTAMFSRCVDKGLMRAGDIRGLARVFNTFRYQWCYQVSVLEREEPVDLERWKRDLQLPIAFFERLFVAGIDEKVPDR